ncbi:MAG: bifunctional adenosylcobinamide kinase/adenosylcobinamide-phosphate guanylyltransferase [Oscillospiraceae bacterium]|nr:bifunctional adenosylcobinamide kinase/adenosylcobinamide-phosphate guanylyltransferase [Oscillospiraceae bacterium]
MKLIIGGYAQGRLTYTLKKYHLTKQDVCDIYNDNNFKNYQEKKIIYHAEEFITIWQNTGKNISEEINKLLPNLQDKIIITQEVGCGLIPISPEKRQWREQVGHLNQALAESSETVERVCCGLGMYIKQESSHVDSN